MELDKLLLKVNKEEQKAKKSRKKANLKKNMVERGRYNCEAKLRKL